jgi:hypothetical protein
MATRIELLKQAGFSDAEIGDWATAERQRMQAAGFTDDEIDEEFGVTRPPKEVPAAFVERLKQGSALQRIAGSAGDYAQRYFGDEPLGFSPQNQEALHKLGVVGDIVIPTAKPVDAVLRSVPAGLAAIGAGAGQAVEEAHDAAFGAGPQAKGKAARDFAQLAQIAALLSGANRAAPAPIRAPALDAASAPALVLPRAEDFRNAAAAISGMPASFRTEQKLLRLWKDHGISPIEVAQDAMHDRAIADDLRSESGKLPEAYVAAGRAAAPTGADPNVAAPSVEPAQSATAESRPGATEVQDGPSASVNESEPAHVSGQSRAIGMYDPPNIWKRPFKFDYRWPPRTDESGRLRFDIEGRPLRATFVAGRRFAGEDDVRLSPDDIRRAIEQLPIQYAETPNIPIEDGDGVIGLYQGYPSGRGPAGNMFIKSTIDPVDQNLARAHEFGHAIDHFSGIISKKLTDQEIAELRKVYTTLRAGPRKTPRPQPEDFGYPENEVNRELVAEGVRAYMANPNYFKMVAPRTAAKIREAVNRRLYLKRVIQFNSLGAAGLAGAGNQDRNDE